MRNEEKCHNSLVQPTSRPAHLFCRPNPSSPLPRAFPTRPPTPPVWPSPEARAPGGSLSSSPSRPLPLPTAAGEP